MNRIRTVVAVLAAVAMTAAIAGVASAGTSASTKAVPFTAKYSGKAVVNSADTIATITASGVGKGSPIGPGKVSGKGKANTAVRPCVPFTGLGTMTEPAEEADLQGRLRHARLRGRRRRSLQPHRTRHRRQRHREAREGEGLPEADRRLRPRPRHLHRQVHRHAHQVARGGSR